MQKSKHVAYTIAGCVSRTFPREKSNLFGMHLVCHCQHKLTGIRILQSRSIHVSISLNTSWLMWANKGCCQSLGSRIKHVCCGVLGVEGVVATSIGWRWFH